MSGERRRWEITAVHPFRDRVTQTDGASLRLGESVVAVPEQAVADAVRAERERVVGALRERTPSKVSWSRGHLAAGYRDAINCIEQLPPADGNTKEEG